MNPSPPAAPGSGRHLGPGPVITPRAAVMLTIALLAILASATFNSELIPAGVPDEIQQYLALLGWLVLIAVSYRLPRVLWLSAGPETVSLVAFYAFAASSILWSNHSPASLLKGLVLAITTFGAYRVAVTVPLEAISKSTLAGYAILVILCLLLAMAVPEIGIDQGWMHKGQWRGVFDSKQSLAVSGGILLVFASHYALTRRARPWAQLAFCAGLAAIAASGSRGGAAFAAAGVAALLLTRRFRAAAAASAFGPLVLTIVALLVIVDFARSDHDYLTVFDTDIDLTERTFIWRHALQHFTSPLIGSGLNSFWSDPRLSDIFLRRHGWVLDNFHSGYITILIETGFIGLALFVAAQLFLAMKLLRIALARALPLDACALIVAYAWMMFIINFTETLFLRSTNFPSTLLLVLLFKACVLLPRMQETGPGRGVPMAWPTRPGTVFDKG